MSGRHFGRTTKIGQERTRGRYTFIFINVFRAREVYHYQAGIEQGEDYLMSFQGGIEVLANSSSERKSAIESRIFGEKVGLIAKLFGCGHRDLSRPFGQGKSTYRTCLQCGARKRFNSETLETFGGFYYPPAVEARHQKV